MRYLLLWLGIALSTMAVAAEKDAGAPPKAASNTGPAAKLPVATFAELPFIDRAVMSPDGTRIAGLFAVGGQQVIAILNIFDRSEKSAMVKIPDQTQIQWVRWVNDDNIVVGLSALLHVDGGDRWYISRLIAINRLTGKVTRLLWDSGGQDASDVLWVPSDGSDEILVAAQYSIYISAEFWPTVYRVKVTTGRSTKVLTGQDGVMNWFADSAGNIRSGLSYVDSSRSYRLLYRPPGNSTFRTIARADTRKREGVMTPFLFLPGTDHALVMHDDDEGRTGVYELDLKTQSDVRTIYTSPEGEVEDVIVSEDGNTLLGVRTTALTDNVHWVDPVLAELQTQFNKAVPNAVVSIESFSRDRKRMIVRVTAADMPGVIYFYDTNEGTLHPLGDINELVGRKRLAPVKLVQYKARDGLDIEAILTSPSGRDPHKLPFIVMPHGGPWAYDGLSYDYWAQFLANRGYAVLQPNFRGSTGYGTDFLRKGEGQMGLAMQDDITDGVNWAIKEGIADPKRLCIVGASYGGYAAMWGIVKDPELYRCAISIAGVANVRREVNDFGSALMSGKFQDDWQRMTPDFAAVSPYNFVDKMKAPLLLIHGKKDVTVDHIQSVRMYGRMTEAKKNVEFVSLPLADHYFTRQEDRATLLTAMEQFLAKYNPAD